MPINSKWILTLGILTLSANLATAGPFSLPGVFKSPSKTAPAETQSNQKVAEQIAIALRKARLTGYDINIEYKQGVATLTGMIQDSRQKAVAEQVVKQIASVRSVENRLGLISPDAKNAIAQTAFKQPATSPAIKQAGFQSSPAAPLASPIQQVGHQQSSNKRSSNKRNHSNKSSNQKQSNQQVANSIAKALQNVQLTNHDVAINYKNGVATFEGKVGSQQQRNQITQVASRVAGVRKVNNQLAVASNNKPVMQTASFQPGPPVGQPPFAPAPAPHPAAGGPPAGMMGPPAGYQPGPPMGAPPMGMGGPGMGHPGPGAVNPVYNQPYLPNHAWPTYAAYPNYGAVTYPKQYSASAFPYIGPFYPYPQVPLGWRSSTLEWDDGQWQLKFSPKTDRWWWFMQPKNWD